MGGETAVFAVVVALDGCDVVSVAGINIGGVVVGCTGSSDVVLTCAGVVGLASSEVVTAGVSGLVESPQIAPLALIEFP